jgi:predicted dehydrogenase
MMIGVGLIGYGYWGPNLARNLVQAGAHLIAASDLRSDRLSLAQTHYPQIEITAHWLDVVKNSKVDAVVVATPPSTHFEIAAASLAMSKHVLVEKPLATTSQQSRRLVDSALDRSLTLMTDHTFVYTSSVQTIRSLVVKGSIGTFLCYDGVRLGRAGPRHVDVDVVWDLAAHDVAIIEHLLGRWPMAVCAIGLTPHSPTADARVTLCYENGPITQMHVSWLSPVKIRRILVGGSRRIITYDDMDPNQKLKVHDCGGAAGYGGASSEECRPSVETGETLAFVARDFLDCILTGRRPLADGEAGLRVVQILEITSASLRQGGRMLRFPDGQPI